MENESDNRARKRMEIWVLRNGEWRKRNHLGGGVDLDDGAVEVGGDDAVDKAHQLAVQVAPARPLSAIGRAARVAQFAKGEGGHRDLDVLRGRG